ncbi:MAG TPA: hypothetical protein VK478_03315 [Gemmatimonadaceae bacterium]|jgi:hypothetical protein|nr:hypothetical protein [Gemmatimonadaceae bacterium]
MNRSLRIAITSLALGACAQLPVVTPPAQSHFGRTLYYARQNVDAGNYWAADKLLDEYVRTHPDTREAREIGFWKAAYLIDPANNFGSLSAGIAALDGYLAADSTGWYRNEATVLRRTAAVAQGVSRTAPPADTAAASSTTVTDTVVVVSRTRDEEIAALKDQLAKSKDELAKVKEELERIKKRLANPSN